LALFLVVLASCNSTAPKPELVAKVNGEGITKQEFDELVRLELHDYVGPDARPTAETEAKIKNVVLYRLVEEHMFTQKARAIGFVVPDSDVETELASMRNQGGKDGAFEARLRRADTSIERVREAVRRRLVTLRLVERLVGEVQVTDAEIEAARLARPLGPTPSATPSDEPRSQTLDRLLTRKRFAKRAQVMGEIRSQTQIEQLLDLGRRIRPPSG